MIQLVIDWTVNPEIFRIGSFSLLWYPLMFVIAFSLGIQIMTTIYKREGKDVEELDRLLIVMLIATILGARIGHFLFYEPQMLWENPLEVFLPIEQQPNGGYKFVGFRGLASHGAILTILPLLYWYSKQYKHNFMWLVDRIAITVALAGGFIRLGNLFNHEIVGAVAENIPWAFRFKYHSDLLPRHPAQLYESILYFTSFFVLWKYYKSNEPNIPFGKLFGMFMVFIFGSRFIIEFFKATQNANDTGVLQQVGLNIGQLLSIPCILIGLYFWFGYANGKGKRELEAVSR